MNSQFTLELAQKLYDSDEVIDFDSAWPVLGYSRKDNAKRKLTGYFEQGFDYFVLKDGETLEGLSVFHLLTDEDVVNRPQGGGNQPEKIYMTVECFKEMGMLAKSKEGRIIRKYFLRCEAISKLNQRELFEVFREQLHEILRQEVDSRLSTLNCQISNLNS